MESTEISDYDEIRWLQLACCSQHGEHRSITAGCSILLTPWFSRIVSPFRFEPEQSLEPDSKPSSNISGQGHAMTTLSENLFTSVGGVDAASEHLDIFISDSKTAVRIENDRKAICQFLSGGQSA